MMNTAESYINEVLNAIPRHLPLREQVAQDLRSSFAEHEAHGRTVAEAIASFPSPQSMAEQYLAEVPLVPATFASRVAAKLIDFLMIAAALSPLVIIAVLSVGPVDMPVWFIAAVVIAATTSLLLGVLSAVAETIYSRTPGKRLLKLSVVRESGARVGGGQAIVRQLPMFMQFYWVDVLFALFTERRQRAFELLSHTRTVQAQDLVRDFDQT